MSNNQKKLSKVVFAKQMEMMNVYYTNFKFFYSEYKTDEEKQREIDLRQKVWYEMLQDIDDTTFEQLVKSYCTKNIFPPQSPTHLIQHFRDVLLSKNLNGVEAFNLVVKLALDPNINSYNEMKQKLLDVNQELFETYEALWKSHIVIYVKTDSDYTKGTLRKEFIEHYENLVKEKVNQKVMIGGTSTLKIGG